MTLISIITSILCDPYPETLEALDTLVEIKLSWLSSRMRLWIASLIFYVFVFATCEVLRLIIGRVLPKRLSSELLLEFVGTLQICTPMFDVNTVLNTYGLFGVFVEITVIELANCYFQRDAFANPFPININSSITLVIHGVEGDVTQW
ncbi:hypothetical protein DICVIV_08569 [Dictyocaulus viviparus]|uniref:Uncharacterized protein n=1 Tax=Dictyocaulus viviparus TaxID=29172 RepID=A0A0D8XNS9_DICVI|nr:hypothetical protein DICVIV_08569 [Dictyocaulus viviparus]